MWSVSWLLSMTIFCLSLLAILLKVESILMFYICLEVMSLAVLYMIMTSMASSIIWSVTVLVVIVCEGSLALSVLVEVTRGGGSSGILLKELVMW